MTDRIRVRVFGGIHIQTDGQQWVSLVDLSAGRIGKKQQSFLTYLLLNHKRRISFAELIEHFWPDDVKDPANSMKNMMFKVRTLLRTAFPEIEELILTKPGGYEWNSEVRIDLDADAFEDLYRRAKNMPTADSLELQMEAFALYNGEILMDDSLEWSGRLNTYYRTVYVDICKSLALQLLEENRWEDVILVCSRGYSVAPEIEEFTCCSMHAMTASGLAGQAVKQYGAYREFLWKEYQLVPSDEIEQAYALAVYSTRDAAEFGDLMVKQLIQPMEQREAFLCSMLLFRNIVQLELRHMLRSKRPASIVVLRAAPVMGTEDLSATDIRRVERLLLHELRAGDPFTRLSRGDFALLLSGATVENSEKVMERLQRSFRSTYPRSKVALRYHIYPLTNE